MKILKPANGQSRKDEDLAERILDSASKSRSTLRSDLKKAFTISAEDAAKAQVANIEDDSALSPHLNGRGGVAVKRRPKRSVRDVEAVDHVSLSEEVKLESTVSRSVCRDENEGVVSGQPTNSECKEALHKAIHLLSMREHSVKELETKLSAKYDTADVVSQVIDFLLENDYVSDSRFAEAFVRSRSNKGQGPIKISADLRSKGVASHHIDEYLDNGSAIWFDIAEQLYSKKYGSLEIRDHKTWSKCARFLQSRGFTMDHIQSTVPQIQWD